jgi:hypothetical protein
LPRNKKLLYVDNYFSYEEMHPPAKADANAAVLSSSPENILQFGLIAEDIEELLSR